MSRPTTRTPSRDRPDAFPPTAVTWLGQRLRSDDAERSLAVRHVMSVYFEPLTIYFKGSSYRTLGDAEEFVSGFFSDRLSRRDYLDRWMGSGLPLRVWLIKGLKYYLSERKRAMRRDGAAALPEDAPDDGAPGPGTAFSRRLANNVVTEALRAAAGELDAAGLGAHWEVFRLHHVEGLPYAQIARLKGIDAERAAVMARTAGRRLRARIRELCAWPGATSREIDDELLSMMG